MSAFQATAAPGFFDRARTIAQPGFNRWLVKSVAEQHYMSDDELKVEKKIADDTHQHFVEDVEALAVEASHNAKVALAWLAVWIPLGWGIWMTVQKTVVLFR